MLFLARELIEYVSLQSLLGRPPPHMVRTLRVVEPNAWTAKTFVQIFIYIEAYRSYDGVAAEAATQGKGI